MAISPRFPSRERGAVLVHVAFLLLALIALSMLVVDFGALWVGRRQAQNAADASALAGAVSLAFDSPTSAADTAFARQSAYAVSQRNVVWGQPPSVQAESDITFGTCPDGINTCVRVNVYRNDARGNPMPMFFGRLVGLTAQGVRATATAMVQPANASNCLKPWGIPDRWEEHYPSTGPWLPTSTFDMYDAKGRLLENPDIYRPPTAASPTGFNVDDDFGRQQTLKPSADPISPGFYAALQLTGPGGNTFSTNISTCANVVWKIGDSIPIEPGKMNGPTVQGARDLIALDPGAQWVGGPSPIRGSCVDTGACPGYVMSPRVVAVPLYSPQHYAEEGATGGRHTTVLVTNILGFFVSAVVGNDVIGYLTTGPGIYVPGAPSLPGQYVFLRTVTMVR